MSRTKRIAERRRQIEAIYLAVDVALPRTPINRQVLNTLDACFRAAGHATRQGETWPYLIRIKTVLEFISEPVVAVNLIDRLGRLRLAEVTEALKQVEALLDEGLSLEQTLGRNPTTVGIVAALKGPFALGQRVMLKDWAGSTLWTEDDIAQVQDYYSDIEGGVRLTKPLDTFVSWNVVDLIPAPDLPEQSVREMALDNARKAGLLVGA